MARAICKAIVDSGFVGIHQGVEQAIFRARDLGALKEDASAELIQRLATCEIAMVHGLEMPKGGLLGIVQTLEKHGLIDKDVWMMLPAPLS